MQAANAYLKTKARLTKHKFFRSDIMTEGLWFHHASERKFWKQVKRQLISRNATAKTIKKKTDVGKQLGRNTTMDYIPHPPQDEPKARSVPWNSWQQWDGVKPPYRGAARVSTVCRKHQPVLPSTQRCGLVERGFRLKCGGCYKKLQPKWTDFGWRNFLRINGLAEQTLPKNSSIIICPLLLWQGQWEGK